MNALGNFSAISRRSLRIPLRAFAYRPPRNEIVRCSRRRIVTVPPF